MAFHQARRRSVLTICIWIFGAGAGFAQAPQSIDQNAPTRRLAALVLSQGYYDAILDQTALIYSDLIGPTAETLLKRPLSPSERDKLQSVVRDTFTTVFPIAVFVDAFAPIYAKYLNTEETMALLDFYGTPLGQRMLLVQGRLMVDAGKLADEQFKIRELQLRQVLQQKLSNAFPQK